jgi:plasmid stabilization system protein ParE
MKVTWTARARTRLAEIHDYIAQDSKPQALAMVERILKLLRSTHYESL